jgi:hypothetical protein
MFKRIMFTSYGYKSRTAIAFAGVKINSPRRILVVDDDNDTRHTSVNALVDAGYDVESAKAPGMPGQFRNPCRQLTGGWKMIDCQTH